MKKINKKILSIPPYISTSWKNINSLYTKDLEKKQLLVIVLYNGTTIDIPNLEPSLIKQVFEAHTNYIEQDNKELQMESLKQYDLPKGNSNEGGSTETALSFGIPFQLNGIEGIENISSFLQHNPNQSSAPQIPLEVIQKMTNITKALGMNINQMNIPKAEPHCSCPYCQIARAIYSDNDKTTTAQEQEEEEEVTEEDLRFRDWDIKQTDDKLYIVSNPFNATEQYQVFLGNPVGCTCGEKNCEHIRTVLNN